MEIGVRLPHTGAGATPDLVRRWCATADDAGFDVLWGVDHVVMPRHVGSKYLLSREPAAIADDAVSARLAPNFELVTTLAFAAACTRRIRLGTAVQIPTIRNAVLNARQLATVDRYSYGRLVVGVGVGWLREEADAMGMPWDRRGARLDEHIALLRHLWTAQGPHVEFHGEFWDVPAMDPEPRPVQQPIPILIGGHSDAAIARAARLGDGWIAAAMPPGPLAACIAQLHEQTRRFDREPSSMKVYCSARPGRSGVDELRRLADLGVDSVQVPVGTLEELERFGDEVLPRLR